MGVVMDGDGGGWRMWEGEVLDEAELNLPGLLDLGIMDNGDVWKGPQWLLLTVLW